MMGRTDPEMTAQDVMEILELFEKHDIEVCLDGGWGVDALLGEQTRSHADLDIAVQRKDVPQIRALLEARGYREVPRGDSWECNFVLGDRRGHEIDIHAYAFDEANHPADGIAYPYDSLNGVGSLNGCQVRCISAGWMVQFHTGYPLDENDYHDVKLLCSRFSLAMPAEYSRFASKDAEPGR